MDSPQYIYNITLHCDTRIADDILYFVKHALLPTWQGYPHWEAGIVLKRHSTPEEESDATSIAIQFSSVDLQALRAFKASEDPMLLKMTKVYPQQLLFTESILEVI